MRPQLNHLIVWSTDRPAAAGTCADVMGMGPPADYRHFTQVESGNGVMLDCRDTNAEPGGTQLAFPVTERPIDEIFCTASMMYQAIGDAYSVFASTGGAPSNPFRRSCVRGSNGSDR